MIPNPINPTQAHFNALCKLGGGVGGGPARTKVQALLSRSGKQLNEAAYKQTAEHLDAVMGPPQVAGFGKRWLSLTVMV